MQDVKIVYGGGSGGFLLLHLLLLSGKFYTVFDSHDSLDVIIDRQWNIKHHKDWKNFESWPMNQLTSCAPTQRQRLYFFCNTKYVNSFFSQVKARSLVLYTDFHSQTELAFYKKAHWFRHDRSDFLQAAVYKDIVRRWNKLYHNLKDPAWPSRVSIRRINQLPPTVGRELLQSSYTQELLQQLSNYLEGKPFVAVDNYHKDLIDATMLPFLHDADMVIKLQDLVNSNGDILLDLLDIPPMTPEQLNLIDRWKKLHPPDLLEKIGIKI